MTIEFQTPHEGVSDELVSYIKGEMLQLFRFSGEVGGRGAAEGRQRHYSVGK